MSAVIIEIMGIYKLLFQSLTHSRCPGMAPVTIAHILGLRVAADPQTVLLMLAFNLWSTG